MARPYVALPVQQPLANELIDWAEQHIPAESLDQQGGREGQPHITIAWGLPDDVIAEDVRRVLAKLPLPLSTVISYPTWFRNHRSVLVLNCKNGPLQPYTDTLCNVFRLKYKLAAHITLAYVQPGKEIAASAASEFIGRTVQSNRLVFVDKEKWHWDI